MNDQIMEFSPANQQIFQKIDINSVIQEHFRGNNYAYNSPSAFFGNSPFGCPQADQKQNFTSSNSFVASSNSYAAVPNSFAAATYNYQSLLPQSSFRVNHNPNNNSDDEDTQNNQFEDCKFPQKQIEIEEVNNQDKERRELGEKQENLKNQQVQSSTTIQNHPIPFPPPMFDKNCQMGQYPLLSLTDNIQNAPCHSESFDQNLKIYPSNEMEISPIDNNSNNRHFLNLNQTQFPLQGKSSGIQLQSGFQLASNSNGFKTNSFAGNFIYESPNHYASSLFPCTPPASNIPQFIQNSSFSTEFNRSLLQQPQFIQESDEFEHTPGQKQNSGQKSGGNSMYPHIQCQPIQRYNPTQLQPQQQKQRIHEQSMLEQSQYQCYMQNQHQFPNINSSEQYQPIQYVQNQQQYQQQSPAFHQQNQQKNENDVSSQLKQNQCNQQKLQELTSQYKQNNNIQIQLEQYKPSIQGLLNKETIFQADNQEKGLNSLECVASSESEELNDEDMQSQHVIVKRSSTRKQVNETKNIPKNFSKAIIGYIQKHPKDCARLLGEEYSFKEFEDFLVDKKDKLTAIKDLRALWTLKEEDNKQVTFNKVFRILSFKFFRENAVSYIYSSRKIKNTRALITYRFILQRALHDPDSFSFMKLQY